MNVMEDHSGTRTPWARVGWLMLVLLLGAAGAALYLRGANFYLLDPHARVDHPDYRSLSPGQTIGHGYGIVGTLFIFANLLYLARRRVVGWQLGSMRAWLNVHVATGLFGGLLVLFHSAFQLRTPLATATMTALGVVIATGLVGRFIYALVPQANFAGLADNCSLFDTVAPGLGGELLARLRRVPETQIPGRIHLLKVIATLPRWRREAAARRTVVYETVGRYTSEYGDELTLLTDRIAETAAMAASVPRAAAFDALMRMWRGMHRFFALLMILLVAVHVAVAWYFGYRWIFSEAGVAV